MLRFSSLHRLRRKLYRLYSPDGSHFLNTLVIWLEFVITPYSYIYQDEDQREFEQDTDRLYFYYLLNNEGER